MMGLSQLVCMLGRKSWPLHGRRSVFGQDSLDVAYDIVDGFREVFDILTRDTGHADTPIGQHVNMVRLEHFLALVGRQTCERKHANLRSDVLPTSRYA